MSNRVLEAVNFSSFKTIRLIATDMDGTLTQSGQFTPSLLHALNDLAALSIPVLIVTGRSAGWVQGLVSYLPVAGAIAENGGIFYPHGDAPPDVLAPITDLIEHRRALAHTFHTLQSRFPTLQESVDNRFRLTDWTFPIHGLSTPELHQLGEYCQQQGWSFTYSTVQCHIKPLQQDKAMALLTVLQRYFPDLTPEEVLTVGDSPNDESLFNPEHFPHSAGVANLLHYRDRLTYLPRWVTQADEAQGFCELVDCLKRTSGPSRLF